MTKTLEQLAEEYREVKAEMQAAYDAWTTLRVRLDNLALDPFRAKRKAAEIVLTQAVSTGVNLVGAAAAYREAWRAERTSERAKVRAESREARDKFGRLRCRAENLMYDIKKQVTEPMYTFDLPLKLNAACYIGGSEGYATMVFKRPVIITKLVAKCRPETFRLASFKFGSGDDATDLLEGIVEGIPADNFFVPVPANSFRAPMLHEGEPVTVKFRDMVATTVPEKLELIVTVRSPYERAEVLGEQA